MTETIEGKIPAQSILRIIELAAELADDSYEEALQIMLVGVAHLLGELESDCAQIDMDGIRMKITTERLSDASDIRHDAGELPSINWNEMSQRGLVFRINNEILHPLGLALSYNPDNGFSECVCVSPEGGFEYSEALQAEARAKGWIK